MAIGIDTNILVRYIVQDDPFQSKAASDLIEKELSEDSLGFINIIVFCELVWVLSKAYKFKKNDIINVIKQVLMTDCFEVELSQLIWNALNEYEKLPADFSDCLIAELNKFQDIEVTLTFDKKASKHSRFKLLLSVRDLNGK